MSGQLAVGSWQLRQDGTGRLIRPFNALASSAIASSYRSLNRPRVWAWRSQCSSSSKEPRAMRRNRRLSAAVQRPVASAMFAPTESAALTAWRPTDQRLNDDHAVTSSYTVPATSAASRYAVKRLKSLPVTPQGGSTVPNLAPANCQLRTAN